jgi:hypothetical protein
MAEPEAPKKGNGIEYSGAFGKIGLFGTNTLWFLGFMAIVAAILYQGMLFRAQMYEQTSHFNHEMAKQTEVVMKNFTDQTAQFLSVLRTAETDRGRLENELRRLEDACRDREAPPRRPR